MARPTPISFRPRSSTRYLPKPRLSYRHASSSQKSPIPSSSRAPLKMPGNMPREDYAAPAMYTLSYLGRIVRFILYGTVGLATVSIASFEGLHYYIEHVSLAVPSRASSSEDEFAWQSENQGWTGGPKGGTDPRLGWKARHALRGAWICQEWGAGAAPGAIGKTGGMHPNMRGKNGTIGSQINRIDRGYELAEEYIDVAISQARSKGLVFPPTLPTVRESGPPTSSRDETSFPQGDPAAIDLLLLKAGVLERISTPDALLQAKELYEQVLVSVDRSITTHQTPPGEARIIRLSSKIGDLCSRVGEGEEAVRWWSWGLGKAGLAMPRSTVVQEAKEVERKVKGWFGWGKTSKSDQNPLVDISVIDLSLPPPVLRATINLLISSSAYYATDANHLPLAAALQSQAAALLPPPSTTRIPSPNPSSASSTLHSIWLRHRSALIALHSGSVAHARGSSASKPLDQVTEASSSAESVVTALNPLPASYSNPRSNPLITSANILKRDSLLLAAEASYTRGLLIEHSLRSAKSPPANSADGSYIPALELAAECFERSMALSLIEAGDAKDRSPSTGGPEIEEGAGRGEEWTRYYRSFARVKSRIDEVAAGMLESESMST